MALASWVPEYWDDQQREVWQQVETHWECILNKDIEAFLKYIHPKFIGFGHESPLPVDKPWLEKWVGFWLKTTEFLIAELRPIRMEVHDDIAIVQYCIFTLEMRKGEKTCRSIRRYTMTWRKAKDRWIVMGSHNNLMNEGIDS